MTDIIKLSHNILLTILLKYKGTVRKTNTDTDGLDKTIRNTY